MSKIGVDQLLGEHRDALQLICSSSPQLSYLEITQLLKAQGIDTHHRSVYAAIRKLGIDWELTASEISTDQNLARTAADCLSQARSLEDALALFRQEVQRFVTYETFRSALQALDQYKFSKTRYRDSIEEQHGEQIVALFNQKYSLREIAQVLASEHQVDISTTIVTQILKNNNLGDQLAERSSHFSRRRRRKRN